jgi:hypothetical protein
MVDDLQAHVLVAFPGSDLATDWSSPMWSKIVRKTYKHFQNQNWIERRKDSEWRITDSGKQASAD